MSDAKRPVSIAMASAAREHGLRRTATIVSRWHEAKLEMQKEINDNDGIYPFNKGKVDVKEVCRRSKISQQTLYAKSGPHCSTTLIEIQEWCKSMAHRDVQSVKKAIGEKAKFWKSEFEKVATQIHIYELAMAEKDRKIGELCEELRRERNKAPIIHVVPSRND